jgi:hypothetical protein
LVLTMVATVRAVVMLVTGVMAAADIDLAASAGDS